MSLILDALNKADKDRNPENTPSIKSDHESLRDRANRLNPIVVYALIGLLVILLITIIIIMLSGDDDNPAPMVPVANQQLNATHDTSSQIQNPPEVAPPPSPEKNVQNNIQNERHAQIKEKMIAQQYASVSESQESRANTPTEPAIEKEAKKPNAEVIQEKLAADKIASIYQQSTEEKPQKKKAKSTPTPTPAPTAPPKLPSLADYPQLSYINDMPYAKQKEIPTLMYTEHYYVKDNSYVTLNKVQRKAGQIIADHLTLEHIVDDGIVLRYKSLRFKISAYNSWINM